MKMKYLPNLTVLEAWKKVMNTKNGSQADKAHKVAVNSIMLALEEKDLLVSAERKKGTREKRVMVHVSGGISTEAAICGLRLIVAFLEREGLPVQSEDINYQAKAS